MTAPPRESSVHLDRRTTLFLRVERATELPMLVLAIAFLVVVAVPEVVDFDPVALNALDTTTWIIWSIFAFELSLKTYLAPNRREYLVTHWIDVVTILVPFLRPVRFIALVILGARFWTELSTVLRRQTFGFVGLTSLIAVVVCSALVYAAERGGDGSIQTYGDALWWAAATITTVGYGDVFPKTPSGRGVAVFLMLTGISLFGLLTARVAAFFVEADEEARLETKLDQILERLERLERQQAERSDR